VTGAKSDSLFVQLPGAVRTGLVRIDFRSTIFYNGSIFEAFVGNRFMPPDAWQRVDPGDATDEAEGAMTKVLLPTLASQEELIGHVSIEPQILTPNSDGVNDQVLFKFGALKIEGDGQISLRIYNVEGCLVKEVGSWSGASGNYEAIWEGLDESGKTVPPGLYLCQIKVDGETGKGMIHRTVAVVY
jgi:hypothetical protein